VQLSRGIRNAPSFKLSSIEPEAFAWRSLLCAPDLFGKAQAASPMAALIRRSEIKDAVRDRPNGLRADFQGWPLLGDEPPLLPGIGLLSQG
jgi:hypothetical protein